MTKPELDRETQELKDVHEMLVGLELSFAQDMVRNVAKKCPYTIRVMRKDGRNCIGTCDFNPDRVNVAVVNGVIKSIISIG